MADQNLPIDHLSRDDSLKESQKAGTAGNISSLHAPILEGWPPAASHLCIQSPLPAASVTTALSESNKDIVMTDFSNNDETNTTTSTNNVVFNKRKTVLLSTIHLPEENIESKPKDAVTKIEEDDRSKDTIMLNQAEAIDPAPATAGKMTSNTTFRTNTTECGNDVTNNNRAGSGQPLDATTAATTQSMPKEVPLHGAPTRKFLNENVTGVLLEGMKMIVKERPSNPLQALGEYLLQRSKELNRPQNS